MYVCIGVCACAQVCKEERRKQEDIGQVLEKKSGIQPPPKKKPQNFKYLLHAKPRAGCSNRKNEHDLPLRVLHPGVEKQVTVMAVERAGRRGTHL